MTDKKCIINEMKSGLSQHNLTYILYSEELPELIKAQCDTIFHNKPICALTPQEKIRRLNDAVKERYKLVDQTFELNGIKLGMFQDVLINTLYEGNPCFKDELHGWRENYPILFKLLDDSVLWMKELDVYLQCGKCGC